MPEWSKGRSANLKIRLTAIIMLYRSRRGIAEKMVGGRVKETIRAESASLRHGYNQKVDGITLKRPPSVTTTLPLQ